MGEMEHIEKLLETHAGYMNKRMDEIHTAVMDCTQGFGDHEVRLSVVEEKIKKTGNQSKLATFASAIGGFVSGFLGGKAAGG